jgi:hypothetical protein
MTWPYWLSTASLTLHSILSTYFLWHLEAIREIDRNNSVITTQLLLWSFVLSITVIQLSISRSRGRPQLLFLSGELVKLIVIALYLLLWSIAVEDSRREYMDRFKNFPMPLTSEQQEATLETPYPSSWSFYWVLLLWYVASAVQ